MRLDVRSKNMSSKAKAERTGQRWTDEEEAQVLALHKSGLKPAKIGEKLGRNSGSIRARLDKMSIETLENVLEEQGEVIPSGESPKTAKSPEGRKSISNAAFNSFHFCYAIINRSGEVYIGYAINVWERILKHNDEKGAKKTKNKGYWQAIYIGCFSSEQDAKKQEIYYQRNFEEFKETHWFSLEQTLSLMCSQISPCDVIYATSPTAVSKPTKT